MTIRIRRPLVAAALLALASTAFAVDPALKKQAKDPDAFRRSDAARALARDGTPEAAAILAELADDRSPFVRDAVVACCEQVTQPESVAVLAKLAGSKDLLARRNAAAALGRTASESALAALGKLARKDASPAVRADALDALWAFPRKAEALEIARDGAADADPFVRAAAVEAAGRIGGNGAPAIVTGALADPDAGVRAVARMELRSVARDAANARIGEAADDPSWRVRAQAVDDAAWLREASSIEALVKLVGDPVLRVSAAAHRALQQLTGKDFGRDSVLWTGWWAQNKSSWRAPEGRPDELKAAADAAKETTAYHGLGIASDRVAFVIDFSGSMRDSAGGSDPRSRWDVAKAELLTAVRSMPDGAKVNVLLFQSDTRRCFDRATPLDQRSRKDVEGLCRASPGETGNLLGAVLEALRDDEIDTIYLLSDGAPSAGEMVDKSRVQAAIRQLNRTRKVTIHTIGSGARKATERAFLESVARDAGGRCVLR